MASAKNWTPGVVIKKVEFSAPLNSNGTFQAHADTQRSAQRIGPQRRVAQGRLRPIMLPQVITYLSGYKETRMQRGHPVEEPCCVEL